MLRIACVAVAAVLVAGAAPAAANHACYYEPGRHAHSHASYLEQGCIAVGHARKIATGVCNKMHRSCSAMTGFIKDNCIVLDQQAMKADGDSVHVPAVCAKFVLPGEVPPPSDARTTGE